MLRSEIEHARRKEALEKKFRRLAGQWRYETGMYSAPRKIIGHPAYRRIIAMGEEAIPLILQDFPNSGGFWHFALKEITGESPVPESAGGRVEVITEAWLKWGREHKYI